MGKTKKTKKTSKKIDEAGASSAGETTHQQSEQPPRKRGRPRKIVEKTESEERIQPEEESESKRTKTVEELEEQKQKGVGSSSSSYLDGIKEEGISEEQKPKETIKSRGRRKGQPHKST